MNSNVISKILNVVGTTCAGCELRIENILKKTTGIIAVSAKYKEERISLTYDSSVIDISYITKTLESLGYKVKSIDKPIIKSHEHWQFTKKWMGVTMAVSAVIIIAAIIFLLRNIVGPDFNISNIAPGMGYSILFINPYMHSVVIQRLKV